MGEKKRILESLDRKSAIFSFSSCRVKLNFTALMNVSRGSESLPMRKAKMVFLIKKENTNLLWMPMSNY